MSGAERLDLLVFGPHPDDIEIGLGGSIAKHTAAGHRVGLCDLTRGELGSNGTVDERAAEGQAAAEVLGAAFRDNLAWPDGGIGPASNDAHVRAAASYIRAKRPRAVAIPHWQDRHPDHLAASQTLSRAIFNAGLRKFDADGDAWRPAWVCYYFINDTSPVSFVIDVSAHYEIKRRALACYTSQFTAVAPGSVETRLTSPRFAQLIESRDAQFGALAGVAFAEGVVVREPVMREGLLK